MKRSMRIRTPVKKYELLAKSNKKIDKKTKKSENRLPVYLKGEYLAVRNESGSYYLCQALQHVYENSKFKLQWLNSSNSSDDYIRDYLDFVGVETVLTEIKLARKDKYTLTLTDKEKGKILKCLSQSLNAGKGVAHTSSDDYEVEKKSSRKRKTSDVVKKPKWSKSSDLNEVLLTVSQIKNKQKASKKRQNEVTVSQVQKKKSKPSASLKPVKAKNAKFPKNVNIAILQEDPTFNSREPLPPVSVVADTKATLLAVRTKNYKLLTAALQDYDRVACESIYQSAYCHNNALDEALLREDLEALKIFYNHHHDPKKKQRVSFPSSQLPTSDTGTSNYKMLGHATAPISAARGSREGNSALNVNDCDHVNINAKRQLFKALKLGLSDKTIKFLLKQVNRGTGSNDFLNRDLYEHIYKIVRRGHVKLAHKMISQAVQRDGYGFSKFFVAVLGDKVSLGNIKTSSVLKKSTSNRKITLIHCAAINPDVTAISELIAIEPNYSIMDQDNNKVIHYAAACTGCGPIRFLINRGASIDDVNKKGKTALHIACKLGRADVVDEILKKAKENDAVIHDLINDADNNKKKKKFLRITEVYNKFGFTALHLAAKHGHQDVIRVMAKYDVNFEKKTRANRECMTALLIASQQGHFEVVKALNEAGAKLENRDRRKKTALIHAVMNGHTHVVSYLLHEGADVYVEDSSGNALVHYAAAYGWWHCLLLILEAGADPALNNDWKLPPLAIALMKHHEGIVYHLLNLPDVNINYSDNNGATLLMHSVLAEPTDELIKQTEFLIEKKNANVTAVNVNGNNAVHYLACTSFTSEKYSINLKKLANILVKNGCNLCTFNNDGETPFHIALKNSCHPLVQLFYDRNILDMILLKPFDDIKTLMHYFVSDLDNCEYRIKFLKSFIHQDGKKKSEKANVKDLLRKMCNSRNKSGKTPLTKLCGRFENLTNEKMSKNAYQLMKIFLDDIGCDPNMAYFNSYDKSSVPPIYTLSQFTNKHVDPLALLLQYEPEVDCCHDRRTPLIRSIECDAIHNVKLLLNAGADVDRLSSQYYCASAIIIAAMKQNIELIRMLLGKNPNLSIADSYRKTLLHHVVNLPRTDASLAIIESILKENVQVNIQDKDGRTALHHAIEAYESGTDSTTYLEELLLKYGADPCIDDNEGRLPLHHAFVNFKKDKYYRSSNSIDPIEMVSVLVTHMKNKNVSRADKDKNSPLHLAASRGASISCLYLTERMADIDLVNSEGNTPLGVAVLHGMEGCALMLLQQKAKFDVSISNISEKTENQKRQKAVVTSKWVHPCLIGKDKESEEPTYTRPLLQEVVKKDWQGVLYTALLKIEMTTGDYNDVIEAAIVENKWNLVLKLIRRTLDAKKIVQRRRHDQTFLHQLAINASDDGKPLENHLQIQVANALMNAGLSLDDTDEFGTVPIIYSSQNWNYILCSYFESIMGLCKNRCEVVKDVANRTFISSVCWLKDSDEFDVTSKYSKLLKQSAEVGVGVDVLTAYSSANVSPRYPGFEPEINDKYYPTDETLKSPKISPLIFAVLKGNKQFLKYIIDDLKADLNFSDEAELTPLMHAIIENDIDLVKLLLNPKHEEEYEEYEQKLADKAIKAKTADTLLSIKRLLMDHKKGKYDDVADEMTKEDSHFEYKSDVDLYKLDKNSKSIIYHLISHFNHCTFDNLRLLQLLICVGYKADKMEWKKYRDVARKVGAVKIAKFLTTYIGDKPPQMAAQQFLVDDGIQWQQNASYDYEDDAELAVEKIDKVYSEPNLKVSPNSNCDCSSSSVVVMDKKQNIPYSVTMNKADITYGIYGFYNFYIMQVVYNEGKDMYVLFTKWGRIGHCGQWQNTPYSTKEEAIKEFCSIFRAKSGNSWDNVQNFEEKPFKYQLVKLSKKKMITIKDFDVSFHHPDPLPSKLPSHLLKVIQELSNIYKLQNRWNVSIDRSVVPFGLLDKSAILRGQQIMQRISDLCEKLEAITETHEEQLNRGTLDPDSRMKSYEIYHQLKELSEEFFYVMPLCTYNNEVLDVIVTKDEARKQLELIDQLLDLDISSKLILAAHHRIKEMNPFDYIYRSLDCKLELMEPTDAVSQYILLNIENTSNSAIKVEAIYKVCRDGEQKRLDDLNMDNHALLWHGTKSENLLSILRRGLRISPINASKTGDIFGRGIYFSEFFAQSYCYTDCRSSDNVCPNFMLLCEVAMGKTIEYDYDTSTSRKENFNSLKITHNEPLNLQYNVTLDNPYGAVLNLGCNTDRYSLNEIVIPDIRQVCTRYLISFRHD